MYLGWILMFSIRIYNRIANRDFFTENCAGKLDLLCVGIAVLVRAGPRAVTLVVDCVLPNQYIASPVVSFNTMSSS